MKRVALLGMLGAGWVYVAHGRALGIAALIAWLALCLLARRALRRLRYPRRLRRARPPIPYQVRRRVMRRGGYRCAHCGCRGERGNPLQIDHIVPWSWGGGNEEGNLAVLCRGCNLAKGARYAG